MPTYTYKCSDCDHEWDVRQRMSDPLIGECPECHKENVVKQISSNEFILKGHGWESYEKSGRYHE